MTVCIVLSEQVSFKINKSISLIKYHEIFWDCLSKHCVIVGGMAYIVTFVNA